jgi:hypothetical protein
VNLYVVVLQQSSELITKMLVRRLSDVISITDPEARVATSDGTVCYLSQVCFERTGMECGLSLR